MTRPDDPPPDAFGVTPEAFLAWRSPRFGAHNPERMNNPVWEWLIAAGVDAYQANKRMDGPSSFGAGPCWCFQRFGQSATTLPDGRVVLVAGEHEDSYDPDFHIYNDVVVRHPDGRVEIFGYPREAFPPTDFHTATLVGDRLVLTGNLGYPDDRRPEATQVLALDLATFAVTEVATTGTPPGWLHGHRATLVEDGRALVVQGGKLDRGPAEPALVENIDDWRLDLVTWQWTRLTARTWQRWEVRREDGKRHHLFDLQQALWSRDAGRHEELREELATLTQELGGAPDLDLAARLFAPSLPHAPIVDEDGPYDTVRISVEGVTVRYVDTMGEIQLTVEGDLPQATIDALAEELRARLSSLEHSPCSLRRL